MMTMKRLLLAIALTSCSSLAWPVDDATTVQQLDARYRDEVATLWQCADMQYDWLMDCPEYHRVWRRYWQARRELANKEKP